MNSITHTQPILVLGGTGKTGRRIVDRLRARDVPVRVGSRSAEIPFSWDDPATWSPAVRGARAVYVSFHPDLAIPGASDAVAAFTRTAVDAGVGRLVLLSGRGEPEAQRSERIVQAAGADWTVVRCSFFNQNFSETFMADAIRAGELALPVDGVPEPFVDAEDIADVATAALTEEGHAGRLYELTGPRLLTFGDAVGEVAAATGRRVRFTPVPVADYTEALAAEGVPGEMIDLLAFLFTEVMDGRNARVADGVERALGRPARDFREYARRTAAEGGWAVS